MKQILTVVVAVLVTLPSTAICQTLGNQATNPDSIRIALLMEQIQLMKDYQNTLLSTVYWSLGIVSALGFLLVGYGWFVNSKSLEREKAALKQELHGIVEERVGQAEGRLASTLSSMVSERIDLHTSIIKNDVEQLDRKVDANNYNSRRQIASAQYVIYQEQCSKEIQNNRLPMAILAARRMLEKAIEMEFDYYVSESLDQILIVLGKIRSSGNSRLISASEISALHTSLESCEPSQSVVVQSIMEQLRNIQTSIQ